MYVCCLLVLLSVLVFQHLCSFRSVRSGCQSGSRTLRSDRDRCRPLVLVLRDTVFCTLETRTASYVGVRTYVSRYQTEADGYAYLVWCRTACHGCWPLRRSRCRSSSPTAASTSGSPTTGAPAGAAATSRSTPQAGYLITTRLHGIALVACIYYYCSTDTHTSRFACYFFTALLELVLG